MMDTPLAFLRQLNVWACLSCLAGCGFPTDRSAEVVVRIDGLSSTVVRGQTLVLRATVTLDDSARVRTEGANVSFEWSSDNDSIASVVRTEGNAAIIRGVSNGRATIRATAGDYRDARAATRTIRVSNTVSIDSVTPDTVRYGEQVTVFGVGLQRVEQVLLGEAALIPVDASLAGDPLGEGSMRFWVPYPASSGPPVAISSEGPSAPASAVTVVIPANGYAGPAGSPITVNLDGPPLAEDGTLFFNPALALTAESPVNVFRLVRSDTTRPLTILVGTSGSIITDFSPTLSLPGDFVDPFGYFGWRIASQEQLCKGALLTAGSAGPSGTKPVTLRRTLQQTFRGGIDLRITGGSPGRYSLQIVEGYGPSSPDLGPDRFEENDYCDGADINFGDPAKRLDAAAGVAELLTIDPPFDIDWFRFSVPDRPDGSDLVTIRTASRPLGAADGSDLGVAIVPVFEPGDAPEDWSARSRREGSSERLTAELPAGDYYLLIADEGGAATPYALCIGLGNDCPLPESMLGRP